MRHLGAAPHRRRERALVCGVILAGQDEEHAGVLAEAKALVAAAGTAVVGPEIAQHRDKPDPATCFGRGKAQEIAEAVREHAPSAVVVDNDLSPGQIRNLEKAWGVRVVDRTELILDIFARRAETTQARLQVELAQVEYLLPRLRRMWTHLERFEGGIGMRGPGETQLETDRRLIRRRIQALRGELAAIEQRAQRQVQSRAGEFTIGLVGYTNAGKSTLMNRLTGSKEFAADMPFATLDTRTRRWKLADGRSVLVSDTVGFLRRLPHHLVASFHATLEEALRVDLLVHVVDASHPDVEAQIRAVELVLAETGQHRRADLIAFNKIDALDRAARLAVRPYADAVPCVWVSARDGEGLDELEAFVVDRLDARSTEIAIRMPLADGRTAAFVRSRAAILSERVVGERLELLAKLPASALGAVLARARDGVEVVEIDRRAPPVTPEAEREARD